MLTDTDPTRSHQAQHIWCIEHQGSRRGGDVRELIREGELRALRRVDLLDGGRRVVGDAELDQARVEVLLVPADDRLHVRAGNLRRPPAAAGG